MVATTAGNFQKKASGHTGNKDGGLHAPFVQAHDNKGN